MDSVYKRIRNQILEKIDGENEISNETLLQMIDENIVEFGKTQKLPYEEKKRLRGLLFSSFRRLDILSVIMDDPEITEVMVNNAKTIFIEKAGRIEQFQGAFSSEEKLADVIQKIASDINRRVNEASPMVDARLEDGSRVNIVLPPIALDGPSVTIRRFPKEKISMDKLISMESITKEAAEYLKVFVTCGYNIFISGGTGAGKTTFLGALAEYIPEEERVVTIEDSAELRLLRVKNLVRLESRSSNLEGNYQVSIRDLIRNALRMRPDRIIVGEIRGPEALDMLQAMNTGHDGSISTGHANSAKDMLSRIETMVLMGMDLPLQAIQAQIAAGLDLIVHVGRLRDKSRRVLGIYEVVGINKIQPLFEFKERVEGERINGALVRTKYQLKNTEKIKRKGKRLPGV